MWLQASNYASAWVSLDERDDDLLTFATYLVTAVQGVFPTFQLKTQDLLQAAAEPSAATVARYLMNDLHQIAERFILVLDDIHLVRQQAIFDLLGELLRHPLPSMHLVLIGRRDPPLPIASLRARGQVTEIRVRDLQFTSSETALLLGQRLDRDIKDEIAVEWTEKTEGWVTALQLAALSLHHRDEMDELRIGISGSTLHLKEYLLAGDAADAGLQAGISRLLRSACPFQKDGSSGFTLKSGPGGVPAPQQPGGYPRPAFGRCAARAS
jgi:LuxR family maltose regulon positive regulatory protein